MHEPRGNPLLPMEAGLNWPDDKDIKHLLDDVDVDDIDDTTTSASATTTTATTTTTTTSIMDDCFFQHFVRSCRNVSEATSYLEIFNYSVRPPRVFLSPTLPPPPPPAAGWLTVVANLAALALERRIPHSTP